ncbi:MAG: 4Fe-4S binding protein [Deltaproteobacteria bacterium]|nr:4Fe-4S binding protein [Deltaproteobacteria bacterium]
MNNPGTTTQADPAQIELAKIFTSVRLFGPPMSDQLMELVCHLFSPQEAAVARYLPFYLPKSARKIARRARRNPDEIQLVLDTLAQRRVIFSTEKGYFLLPLMPGMFEYLLMDGRDTPWHRRYGQLITSLFATGYTRGYSTTSSPIIRNIPVETAVEPSSRIVDSDLMSEMIDAHEKLAVLHVCQCRQSHMFSGHECSRSGPEDGCLVFGGFAQSTVENGNGRFVSKEEMHDIVLDRWEKNLVFFSANIEPSSPNAICTCCDCCCHYMKAVNVFAGGVSLAPPHFLAHVDESICNSCGKCTKVCNTHAHTVRDRTHLFALEKCIGCGLCVDACAQHAVTMRENPDYRPPSKNWIHHGLRILPAGVMAAVRASVKRMRC